MAVVYYAGHTGKEKVVKGTLNDILAKVGSGKEKWWGMIIVGRCLTGPAFTSGQ
jgi:uroporphyrin-III C-methyltransferase